MALQKGHYLVDTDVDNWVAEESDANKLMVIQAAEELIEKITKDYFYAKTFTLVMDGNGRDRLFLGLRPNILSITQIKLSGVVLNANLYGFSNYAVFRATAATSQCKAIEGITLAGSDPVSINITDHGFITGNTARLVLVVGIGPSLDGEYVVTKVDADNFTLNSTVSSDYTGSFISGTACFATLAELHYLTGRKEGVFPKGLANVEITGTYGWAACPGTIKQVAVILCRYANNETLYTKYDDLVSDKLGDASYSRGDKRFLTGIQEADRLLRNYIRKRPILNAI